MSVELPPDVVAKIEAMLHAAVHVINQREYQRIRTCIFDLKGPTGQTGITVKANFENALTDLAALIGITVTKP